MIAVDGAANGSAPMDHAVHAGRYTAELGADGVTVFLIGMRLNKPWRVDKWWPVSAAMPRMLRHLRSDPDGGLLCGKLWFGRDIVLISYWRDAESLQRFAAASTAPHRAAWQRYTRAIGSDGTVGIWHETYVIRRGCAESVYANMPRFGLARATGHVKVTPATTTAKKRLAGVNG